MSISSIPEKIGFIGAPGGATATCWWIVRALTGLEAYYVLAAETAAAALDPPRGLSAFCLATVSNEAEYFALTASARERIDGQSGMGVQYLVANGRTVYVLLDGSDPACQLTIYRAPFVDVDSPGALRFAFGPNQAFLGFLYTHPQYLRRGAASTLLSLVARDLHARGIREILAYVRATNVPSLGTFRRRAWGVAGRFLTNRKGRLAFVGKIDRGLAISELPTRA